jgi:hypothetical protein
LLSSYWKCNFWTLAVLKLAALCGKVQILKCI